MQTEHVTNKETEITRIPNKLVDEKSPYLLQHAYNPVNWYPWGEESFEKAKKENKPIFLSIGYSTCHWCHVMAHESFEDLQIAELLNNYYVSIKVDKEERPDIDSLYMAFCQAFTGSGGWPTSIFMTPEQKPFYAGTYFPKNTKRGMLGFTELLMSIHKNWEENNAQLINSAEEIMNYLDKTEQQRGEISETLLSSAALMFKQSFDKEFGGFGLAPKFPTPHNLLFLMDYYEQGKDKSILTMVETTLTQMYRGGIFDHIGYGFSRYSTDRYFLVPHFEKMLYDNALLIMSYAKLYYITKKSLYRNIAEKTAEFILREMTKDNGGFYCAQDADSEGVEGKYYVFDYDEVLTVLGKKNGEIFNHYYGITERGNFEGKNIPNLLANENMDGQMDEYIPLLYDYRRSRTTLHLDDKILTSWNALMIAAFALLYRVMNEESYLQAAKKTNSFIEQYLSDGNSLFVSYREGEHSGNGFLDDYSFYIFALIGLYEATNDSKYLDKAIQFCNKVISDFYDEKNGGFYLYGRENESLIIKRKETYDGAIPSGNSVMAYNLVKLSYLIKDPKLTDLAEKQLTFMSSTVKDYPPGYSFYLLALSLYLNTPEHITIVLKNKDDLKKIKGIIHLNANVTILLKPTEEYKFLNEKTTYYVCKNHSCLPPTNEFYYNTDL